MKDKNIIKFTDTPEAGFLRNTDETSFRGCEFTATAKRHHNNNHSRNVAREKKIFIDFSLHGDDGQELQTPTQAQREPAQSTHQLQGSNRHAIKHVMFL